MDTIIRSMKALSDRNRLRTLCALKAHSELCACQLTELLEISGATVSRHMGVLIAAGLVSGRKDGRWVYYRLSPDDLPMKSLLSSILDSLLNDPQIAEDLEKLTSIVSRNIDNGCNPKGGNDE